MKQIILIITTSIICYSCGSNSGAMDSSRHNIPENYVVLLDLSDRLINNPNQTDIDTTAIRTAFEKFEMAVKKQLVVKSKEIFSVRIIDQKGSNLPINNFENNLTLNLGAYTAAEKLIKLNQFKNEFGKYLKMLYQQAFLGTKSENYFGVDIWQYFNEQINTDIKEGYKNQILVLTDGYFDFEDKTRGLNSGNQSTITRHLISQLRDVNWKEKAEKSNVGIIPVKIKSNVRFIIAGIQSKSDDLMETSKLSYLWSKWIQQSGAKIACNPIINASSGKIKNIIMDNL